MYMPGSDHLFVAFFSPLANYPSDSFGERLYTAFFFSGEKLSFAARLLKKRTFKYFSALFCLLAAKIYGKTNNLILFKDTWKNGL